MVDYLLINNDLNIILLLIFLNLVNGFDCCYNLIINVNESQNY